MICKDEEDRLLRGSRSRRALLVDTGFSAWPIYDALIKAGFEVFVVGNNPSDALAKSVVSYVQLDYSRIERLKDLVITLSPDFLVPGCNDLSYQVCARVADELGFSGFDSLESIHCLFDKGALRATAARLGLRSPRVFELNQCTHEVDLIVKPVDSFSGKGVTIVRKEDAGGLTKATEVARAYSRTNAYLVEEFIEGQLYSHSAFLSQQQIAREFWVIEYCSVNPFVVDVSHAAFDLSPHTKELLRDEITKLAADLKLSDGLLHTQFICSRGIPVVIEVTRRCPGDLYSHLIAASTGFDYPSAYIAPFCGLPITLDTIVKDQQQFVLRHTVTGDSSGRLRSLDFLRPVSLDRWVPLLNVGDTLAPSPSGRVGILFSHCESESQVAELADAARNRHLYRING